MIQLKYLLCRSLITWVVIFLMMAIVGRANAQVNTVETETTQNQISQLSDLVISLKRKLQARETLREIITTASADEIAEQQTALNELNEDIRETRFAIEQVAVGSVDLAIFEEQELQLDWRSELSQIMMPVVQNLKRITEKPRKIEIIKAKIQRSKEQQSSAESAADNVLSIIEGTNNESVRNTLQELYQSWLNKAQDTNREINLAKVQLSNLERDDGPLWLRTRDAVLSFSKGRGLTLFLAVAAGFGVYLGAQFLAKLFTKRQKGEDLQSFRTRERIIHYALKAVKTMLILIAVMTVFYLRGDILLMTLALLIIAGLVLSLRNAIPRFLDELRLLLNLGAIREDERVMYQGLPWKVTKLNVYSVLKNPEITGVLRIPLQEMMSLTSRPSGSEPWFPASRNDYVLLNDDRLLQVRKLTPEHVLLQSLAGTETMIPTAEFYNTIFENLSRSPTYSVSSVFGVGYNHQGESIVGIPSKFTTAIERALLSTDVAEHVVSVNAELQAAGASSLDFWIGIKMNSEAATSYFKVKRLIQQVCVATCSDEQWDIPFPQLTLHNPQ